MGAFSCMRVLRSPYADMMRKRSYASVVTSACYVSVVTPTC